MKSFTISTLLATLLTVAFASAQDFIKPDGSAKRHRFLPPGFGSPLDKVDSELSLLSPRAQNFSGNIQDAWKRHYASGLVPADDFVTAMTRDPSGNVYVTGYSTNRYGFDYFTAKYNAAGAQVWSAYYDGADNGDDRAFAIAVEVSGNVYVTGESYGTGSSYDYATIKYDSTGVEQWIARHNGPGNSEDKAAALAVDPDGNVYVTGSSAGSSLYSDYATIKYNSAGAEQWVAAYNGPGNSNDGATALAVDPAGKVYVTGFSAGSGPGFDFATIKYSSSGTELRVARYNGPGDSSDWATALAVDPAGSVYVTGWSEGSGTSRDYATIKYDGAGEPQWVARYNGPGNSYDEATALAVDPGGNVYVTGGSGGDYATIKYNGAGMEQWAVRCNGPENSDDAATALAVDPVGNVYVTGISRGLGTNNENYLTVKYNFAGTQGWVATYNGPGNSSDKAAALVVDSAGNVYVSGYSVGSDTSYDYATVKYNGAGAPQWVDRYNGPGGSNDAAYAIGVDAAGNVYVTGRSFSASTRNDYATIKYNSTGIEQWVARYNGPGNSDDYALALAVDAAGNVYVTGYSAGPGTGDDYTTIKYNGAGKPQWVARYNGPGNSEDHAAALAVDPAGNVCVTGYSGGSGISSDYATIKYNGAGQLQWVDRYNGPGNSDDEATALAVNPAGDVYVTGYSGGDYATIKYNGAGAPGWITRYNGPGSYSEDYATALAVDPAGNVYVTGDSYSDISYDYPDYTTIKYDGAGTEQWVARYSGSTQYFDNANALAVDPAGNVYVTGGSYSTFYDYATVKYNSAGAEQWVARYNGTGDSDNAATALAIDPAGNAYVTGLSYGSDHFDYATIKYNDDGAPQWAARFDGPGVSYDYANALALDHFGNVYVTGTSEDAKARAIYTTIKYNQDSIEASVNTISGETPAAFELGSNYPNPFNPETTILYTIPAQAGGGMHVSLRIYSLQGQLVHTLVDEQQPPGRHRVVWDGKNSARTRVSSGVYLYTLTAGHFTAAKKMAIFK